MTDTTRPTDLSDVIGELRDAYAALNVKPDEEWYALIGSNGYDLCLEGARYRGGQEHSGPSDIIGRFSCGGYAIKVLPVVAQVLNHLPALLDALEGREAETARLREATCRMLAAYRELRVQFDIHEEQAEHILFALDVVESDDDELRKALAGEPS